MHDVPSPLEYLVTSSLTSLEAFELTRLNRAANLRKEVRDVLEEWLQTEIDARLARWILECRRAKYPEPEFHVAPSKAVRFGYRAEPYLEGDETVAPRVPALREEIFEGSRSHPHGSEQEASSRANQPVSSPMRSRNAAACLRLLEQFLAHAGRLADGPGEVRENERRGAPPNSAEVFSDSTAETLAESPQAVIGDQPIGYSKGPRQNLTAAAVSRPAICVVGTSQRRRLHPGPPIRSSIFSLGPRNLRRE